MGSTGALPRPEAEPRGVVRPSGESEERPVADPKEEGRTRSSSSLGNSPQLCRVWGSARDYFTGNLLVFFTDNLLVYIIVMIR